MIQFDENGPVMSMLESARNTVRFHMPGHKGLLSLLDMTELARTDDLYMPVAALATAERMGAMSCGASRSIMLSGGSTAGLMTMLLVAVSPGETIILPRDAHHAAVSACVWGDLNAVFVEDLQDAIATYPEAKAVLVTYPDYYGHCIDIVALVALAHTHGMLLLVDEAHGAHFPWWDSPKSAGFLGADAWVQSAHKTLPALTGAAWLHLSATIDAEKARRTLRMFQTSSPPFPILASLDNARHWMDLHGRDALAALIGLLEAFRFRVAALPGIVCFGNDDPTRLVLDVRGRGLTGFAAQTWLSSKGVDVEMADDSRLVCICTVADTQHSFDRLWDALETLPIGEPLERVSFSPPSPGERVLSIREAALSRQASIPFEKAMDRIASVSAGLYPPGIPVLLPGERITKEAIQWLSSLPEERRFGLEKNCLICVK